MIIHFFLTKGGPWLLRKHEKSACARLLRKQGNGAYPNWRKSVLILSCWETEEWVEIGSCINSISICIGCRFLFLLLPFPLIFLATKHSCNRFSTRSHVLVVLIKTPMSTSNNCTTLSICVTLQITMPHGYFLKDGHSMNFA